MNVTDSMIPPVEGIIEGPQTSTDLFLQIGDVAKMSGVTLRTLRYYEEIGLIEPHNRSKGNFRLYHPNVVRRVGFISSLKELDFSLDQIRELLGPIEEWSDSTAVIYRSIMALKAKQQKISEKLNTLSQMNQEVNDALKLLEAECLGCKATNPNPCETECSQRHHHLA